MIRDTNEEVSIGRLIPINPKRFFNKASRLAPIGMSSPIRSLPKFELKYSGEDTTRPSKLSSLKYNYRFHAGWIGVLALVLTIPVTWPEPIEGLVYEGEVWGDVRAEGYIWGEHVAEHDHVYVSQILPGDGERLHATVTNVSSVRLLDPPHGNRIDSTVVCENGTFEIIAEEDPRYRSSIMGQWWDVDFDCVYAEFNGTFEGTHDEYWPIENVSWVEGSANIRHDPKASYDISIDDCIVIIDGIEYVNASWLFIPEGETATITIGGSHNMRVGSGLFPHINGTLEVDEFNHLDGFWTDKYQTIKFGGDDIEVRTTQASVWFEHWGESYDPWIIEVTASSGTEIEISETSKIPIAISVILVILLLVFIGLTLREFVLGLKHGSDDGSRLQ
jgi:hypothetical protein